MSGPVTTQDAPTTAEVSVGAVEREVELERGPHRGLQTVTWLVLGELLHRDSLGPEQLIRPGQLNLMTARAGVAHAEENAGRFCGELHAINAAAWKASWATNASTAVVTNVCARPRAGA